MRSCPPTRRGRRLGLRAAVALGTLAGLGIAVSAVSARAGTENVARSHERIALSARQLIVVSSPTDDPPGSIATLRTYQRSSATSRWEAKFASFDAEIGAGELRGVRREGDRATPTGVYPIGVTMYGNAPNPGGLHEAYHRLVCGDWWDEDPYSDEYNRFVHVSCGTTPEFAPSSEALWTETTAYPYLAVIDYNVDPIVAGPNAPGSGIFLHAWVGEPTEGCVALPVVELLLVLRWLRPADHPEIEIGTNAEVGHLPGT